MQIAQLDRKVETSGIAQQQKMGMVLDGTAFKILSDGLYSDKIGSLVRETYSNVIDSHIMAGEPHKPGWIQVPNNLDPTYVVRDEGIGLDAEGVMTTATTYFGSTKRGDDVAIGGFGLGFKSPFAYSDQWTIIAVKDGFKRTFSAYMTEEGEPNVAMLTEEQTNEPNGVEVRVPVKRSDIYKFEHAIEQQLQYFEPRPQISGAKIHWPDQKYILEGDGYRLTEYNSHREGAWRALIGPVAFPIEKSQVTDGLSHRAQSMVGGVRGELMFEVGEVMPSPSRESLQYNPKTVKAIQTRLEEAADNLAQKLTEEVQKADTYWEACCVYRRVVSGLSWGMKSLVEKVTYHGAQLNINMSLSDTLAPGVSYATFSEWDLGKDRFALKDFSPRCSISADTDTWVFLDDLPNPNHRQASRIKHYYETNFKDKVDVSTALVLRASESRFQSGFETVLKALNGFPEDKIVRLSEVELPVVPRAKASAAKKSLPPGIRKVDRSKVFSSMCTKDDADTCSTVVSGVITPGRYVVIEHNQLPSPRTLSSELIKAEDLFPGDLYFIPKSAASKIDPDDGWVDFLKEAKEEFAKRSRDVKRAISLRAEADSTFNLPGLLENFFKELIQQNVEPPKRTQSAFWKLYREYLRRSQIKLSGEEKSLREIAAQFDEDDWTTAFNEAREKFNTSMDKLEEEFKESNPTFWSVLTHARYGLTGEIVKDLAQKLG